ncbi:hypothetical protein C8034_v009287 [Colletotrichum sidae]|uniref:Uncharacterized protein n=1 Tax=Colletotrichum sidae TaxID=1347389 RepID=A0A4R8T2I4_9PEZI|nr:hypothetical protein C8034_v009287 [Colletotrichum sidae]
MIVFLFIIILIIVIIIIIRTNYFVLLSIIIFNLYNFNININFIKIIDNYKNYSYFYKDFKRLVLYKCNFSTLSTLVKIIITLFYFNI